MKDFLEDREDFQAQLVKMQCEDISKSMLKRLRKLQHDVNRDLAPVGLQPNNAQYGCAVAALYKREHSRSIISVPTGKGKSRIIAAVVNLAVLQQMADKFTVVYSSELLKSVDQRNYELLATLLRVEIQQVVFDKEQGLENQVEQDRFLLIDEADFILIDNVQTVHNQRVVGLSATAFTGEFAQESLHLRSQRFKVLESNM